MGQTLRRNSKNLRRDRFAPSWELRRKTTWLLRLSCSTLTKSVPLTVHQTTSHRNWDLRIVRKYFQSESKCKSTSLSKLRKGERKGDSGICQLSTQASHPIYIAETLKEVPAEKSFNPGKGRRGKAEGESRAGCIGLGAAGASRVPRHLLHSRADHLGPWTFTLRP